MTEQNTAHGDPCPDYDEPHPLEGLLEPATRDRAAGTEYALTSIAISLKRIADVLEGGATDRMTIFELIADRMPSQ